MNSLLKLGIDDVIGMTHRKKILDQQFQIKYFLKTFREITWTMSKRFDGHFKKSTEFGRNFKMRTVSLKGLHIRKHDFNNII